ncbi:MAG TPA: hypothetical protein VNT25_01350 [Allosphingosinicella sp.]|nr:hypothetical protein [Allosphingosinicella sp.]
MFQQFSTARRGPAASGAAHIRGCSSAGRALLAVLLLLPAAALSQSTDQPAQPGAEEVPVSSVGVNLNITPRRLTFDRNTRSASVYIFNQGTAPATFDISLVDRVMLPSGEIREVAEVQTSAEWKPLADKLKSAHGLVIATPRRATLAPGKGQTIRIRANQPPAGAAEAGEYRTHLTVTTIPPRDLGLTAEEAANQQPGELNFRIQSIFGLSIPVIVRPGAVDVQGDIQNVALSFADLSPDGVAPARRTAVLGFDILRTGSNSLFGNVEIRSGQDKEPIGLARGIGVYPEIDRRSVRIPLRRQPRAGERLEIVFTDDDSKPGSVVARSSYTVP